MTQLRRLQQALQRHLLDGDGGITGAILEAPPLPVAARLAIYRDAYRVRLIEALDDTYPVLHQVLGDDVFVALGGSFVASHASVYRSIRWYGRELPQFLRHCAPYAQQPILTELALFEWTLAEAFDAADAEPVPRTALHAVEAAMWSDLTFQFHPSLRHLAFHWNTVAVWAAVSGGEAPPEPACVEHAVPWLLWRRDLQNFFRSMDAAETVALHAALRGRPFGEICATLAEWLPESEVPLRAANLIGTWMESGIIVALG